MEAFTYARAPARIIFGAGRLQELADELRALGLCRALILSTPQKRDMAEALAAQIGSLSAGIFSDAAMHTPVEVTTKALTAYNAVNADCVIAFGGGSTTGLGKAIAYRNGAPQIVVAITYAGSEVTPVLGQTENGIKTTVRGPEILPEVVIYDPELTVNLPVQISIVSGLNAMAHALEGFYAQDRNPVSTLLAGEGLRALTSALPKIIAEPSNLDARTEALFGAWLCGDVLGSVGMSIHHKLCHTLGGSFNLPHAQTHAILLPHTIAYVAEFAQDLLQPATTIFGERLGAGIYDFAASLGAPQALRDMGLEEADLDRAAALAVASPYWCPRPLERNAIRELLQNAWEGRRP